jgi:hypothetical protein
VDLARWRREDGFVREIVLYLAVVVVIAVVVFDSVSVMKAYLGVRQNASDAADEALNTYVQTGNTIMAENSASAWLKLHDAALVSGSFKLSPSFYGPDKATVTVGAKRDPHTYLFHYLQSVPWGIGDWFERMINPRSVQNNT